MQTVLKNISDQRLKAYIIWLPVLPTDNRNWAVKRVPLFERKARELLEKMK